MIAALIVVVIILIAVCVYGWYEINRAPKESETDDIDPDYFP